MSSAKFNVRNPAVKRIMQEIKELQSDSCPDFIADALEEDIFEWHFVIKGPSDTEFEGGIYHGRILLPAEYPFKPPAFMMLTPNGRFQTGTKICLSISSHHPEHWQPSWSVRTALTALIAFMPTPGQGAIGSLDFTKDERVQLAAKSRSEVPKFGSAARQKVITDMHTRFVELQQQHQQQQATAQAAAAGATAGPSSKGSGSSSGGGGGDSGSGSPDQAGEAVAAAAGADVDVQPSPTKSAAAAAAAAATTDQGAVGGSSSEVPQQADHEQQQRQLQHVFSLQRQRTPPGSSGGSSAEHTLPLVQAAAAAAASTTPPPPAATATPLQHNSNNNNQQQQQHHHHLQQQQQQQRVQQMAMLRGGAGGGAISADVPGDRGLTFLIVVLSVAIAAMLLKKVIVAFGGDVTFGSDSDGLGVRPPTMM